MCGCAPCSLFHPTNARARSCTSLAAGRARWALLFAPDSLISGALCGRACLGRNNPMGVLLLLPMLAYGACCHGQPIVYEERNEVIPY